MKNNISPPPVGAHYEQLLGLTSPWKVADVAIDTTALTVVIKVETTSGTALPCPTCAKPCPLYDHRDERRWRHLDTMQFTTTIVARIPRISCPEHAVVSIRTPWADDITRFTLLFEHFAIDVLQASASLTQAKKILKLSWDQFHLIQKRAVERGLARRNQEEVIPHIGIDEKSFLKGHHYASLATDIDGGRVLDVEEGRKRENTEILLHRAVSEEQRTAVQAIAMDMWEPFMNAAKGVFGQDIPIVHDKFHVSGYLGKAVDKVRKGEHRELKKEGNDTLTKTKYLWLKNPDTWEAEERAQFKKLQSDELKVGRAWSIKESFRKFWEYTKEWSARRFFNRWYFWATHSRLTPMIDVAKTLKRHLDGLLAYMTHPITNAVTEGLNSKIQSIKANARGFRNFANYRIAILFHCGKLSLYP